MKTFSFVLVLMLLAVPVFASPSYTVFDQASPYYVVPPQYDGSTGSQFYGLKFKSVSPEWLSMQTLYSSWFDYQQSLINDSDNGLYMDSVETDNSFPDPDYVINGLLNATFQVWSPDGIHLFHDVITITSAVKNPDISTITYSYIMNSMPVIQVQDSDIPSGTVLQSPPLIADIKGFFLTPLAWTLNRLLNLRR
jgi:hypothetical protein